MCFPNFARVFGARVSRFEWRLWLWFKCKSSPLAILLTWIGKQTQVWSECVLELSVIYSLIKRDSWSPLLACRVRTNAGWAEKLLDTGDDHGFARGITRSEKRQNKIKQKWKSRIEIPRFWTCKFVDLRCKHTNARMYRYRPRSLAHQKEKEEKTSQTQEKNWEFTGKTRSYFSTKKSFLRPRLGVLVAMVSRNNFRNVTKLKAI